MDTIITVTEGEVDGYAAELLGELASNPTTDGATLVTLSGDLGAGKTTLVQALGRALGVTEVVTSPTFVVMKSYETTHPSFTTLIHVDAYRIDDVSELGPLNFNHLLQTPHTLVCLEWPERITSALPQHVQALSLEAQPDGSRVITQHGS